MLLRWAPVSGACRRWLSDFGYGYGAQASYLLVQPAPGVTLLSDECSSGFEVAPAALSDALNSALSSARPGGAAFSSSPASN